MRSRILFLLALLGGTGCSSSVPSSPTTSNQPTNSSPETAPEAKPRPTLTQPYQLDPSQHVMTQEPVSGVLGGKPFKPEHVLFRNNVLTFRVGKEILADREVNLLFQTATDQAILPLRLQIDPAKPSVGGELAIVNLAEIKQQDGLPETQTFTEKFALTLELSDRKQGLVKGEIYLCLPDADKSYLQGSFEAVWLRPFGGPLDAEEVPYFDGRFRLPPNAESVRFGYLAETTSGDSEQCTTIFTPKNTPEGTSLGSSSGDILGRGDIFARQEKGEMKFDASRLKPGRYLVWAMVERTGPIAFDWIDITATSRANVELKFPQETGGLEIQVPDDFQGKVDLTPSDPKQTDSNKEFAIGRYNPVVLESAVQKGQGNFTNLTPGRYRYRLWQKIDDKTWSGGTGNFVEVKAGSVTKVTSDKK